MTRKRSLKQTRPKDRRKTRNIYVETRDRCERFVYGTEYSVTEYNHETGRRESKRKNFRRALSATSWAGAITEVERNLDGWLMEIERRKKNLPPEPEPKRTPTLAELAPAFMEEIDASTRARSTKAQHRSAVRTGRNPGAVIRHLGHLPVDLIEYEDVARFLSAHLGARETTTAGNYLSVLSNFFRWATKNGYRPRKNPAREYREWDYKSRRTAEPQPLQDDDFIEVEERSQQRLDEYDANADAVAKRFAARSHLMLVLLLDTGMRIGEGSALRWDRVRLDTRRAAIAETFDGSNSSRPKTDSSRRTIDLSKRIVRMLAECRPTEADDDPKYSGYVFGHRDDPMRPEFDHHNFRVRWIKPLVGDGHTTHHLRHTFASQLLSAGVPVEEISRQLGHTNSRVTRKHYATWVNDGLDEPMRLGPGEKWPDLIERLQRLQKKEKKAKERWGMDPVQEAVG